MFVVVLWSPLPPSCRFQSQVPLPKRRCLCRTLHRSPIMAKLRLGAMNSPPNSTDIERAAKFHRLVIRRSNYPSTRPSLRPEQLLPAHRCWNRPHIMRWLSMVPARSRWFSNRPARSLARRPRRKPGKESRIAARRLSNFPALPGDRRLLRPTNLPSPSWSALAFWKSLKSHLRPRRSEVFSLNPVHRKKRKNARASIFLSRVLRPDCGLWLQWSML